MQNSIIISILLIRKWLSLFPIPFPDIYHVVLLTKQPIIILANSVKGQEHPVNLHVPLS